MPGNTEDVKKCKSSSANVSLASQISLNYALYCMQFKHFFFQQNLDINIFYIIQYCNRIRTSYKLFSSSSAWSYHGK